jgi:protease-4
MQVMLDLIHQRFIAKVKEGRGDRLKVNDDMFSGLFWTGTQAKDLGLIDGFASSGQLARDIIKLEKIVDYSEKTNVWEQMAKNIGMSAANQLPKALGLRPTIQ